MLRLSRLHPATPAACFLTAVSLWLGVAVAPAVRAAGNSSSAGDDVRFSQTMSVDDRKNSGIDKLTSDQLGAFDALVRRDLATVIRRNEAPAIARFSDRLTADERRVTGLTTLTPLELAQLDACVDRRVSAAITRILSAPPSFVASPTRAVVTEDKTLPGGGIHGSFTLSMGWGSGGYSERTGSMTLFYNDPVHDFSVSFTYTQSQIKGGPMVLREPFYDPLP